MAGPRCRCRPTTGGECDAGHRSRGPRGLGGHHHHRPRRAPERAERKRGHGHRTCAGRGRGRPVRPRRHPDGRRRQGILRGRRPAAFGLRRPLHHRRRRPPPLCCRPLPPDGGVPPAVDRAGQRPRAGGRLRAGLRLRPGGRPRGRADRRDRGEGRAFPDDDPALPSQKRAQQGADGDVPDRRADDRGRGAAIEHRELRRPRRRTRRQDRLGW